MKARFFALIAVAAGLAGCAASSTPPGPAHQREMKDGRPGMFGDLSFEIDTSGKRGPASTSAAPATAAPAASAASVAEQEEFKKWRESAGSTERSEFEEWRAWQEWKRKNPK